MLTATVLASIADPAASEEPTTFSGRYEYLIGSDGDYVRRRGRPVRRPRVTVGQVTASAGLDARVVRRHVVRHAAKLIYCYEKGLLVEPTLTGTVATWFLIDGTGHVRLAWARGVDPDVATCVEHVLVGLEFPPPAAGVGTHVRVPITLRPP